MSISLIISVFVAILALSIIIFVHEAGHFIFAKIFNVGVLEFSIGMGPRIFSFVKNNTRYSIKAIPFGGSCAMIGEDPSGAGDFSIFGGKELPDGKIDFNGVVYSKQELNDKNFQNCEPFKKLLICVAGPLFNFLLAFLLSMILVSYVGTDIPYIGTIQEASPASNALPTPLQKGDLITNIEIPTESQKVTLSRDVQLFMFIHDNDFTEYKIPLGLTFERNNETYTSVIYPKYDKTYNKNMIGISFSNERYIPKNIIELIQYAIYEVGFNIISTIKSLKLLIFGKISAKEISGPVGTVAVMGETISEASTYGMINAFLVFINLIILISANLGVMNLLPIPALDGGRIIFALYEMITGSKINPKVESYVNSLTMILLLLLMLFVFGNDIVKLISGV